MATEIFHSLLRQIQISGLNFKMELSPFSASIIIKNSLLKDRNGKPIIASLKNKPHIPKIKTENDEQARLILHQEKTIGKLQADFESALNDSENLDTTKNILETVVDTLHDKLSESEVKNVELSNAIEENKAIVNLVEDKMKKQKQEVSDLAVTNANLKSAVNKLDKEHNNSKIKSKSELAQVKKDFKTEIKEWRKELGEERKIKIKLENKLVELKQKSEEVNETDENNEDPPDKSSLTWSSTHSSSSNKPSVSPFPSSVSHWIPPTVIPDSFQPTPVRAVKAETSSRKTTPSCTSTAPTVITSLPPTTLNSTVTSPGSTSSVANDSEFLKLFS